MENYKNDILDFAYNTFCLKNKINEEVAKEYFLTPIDVDMLSFIYIFPEAATATDIERERNIKKNTISIHVENLVQLGLLERQERHGDRRKVRLTLTDKAKTIAETCIKKYKALGMKLHEGLTENEIENMMHYFQVISQNAIKLLNK